MGRGKVTFLELIRRYSFECNLITEQDENKDSVLKVVKVLNVKDPFKQTIAERNKNQDVVMQHDEEEKEEIIDEKPKIQAKPVVNCI